MPTAPATELEAGGGEGVEKVRVRRRIFKTHYVWFIFKKKKQSFTDNNILKANVHNAHQLFF